MCTWMAFSFSQDVVNTVYSYVNVKVKPLDKQTQISMIKDVCKIHTFWQSITEPAK